MPATLRVPAIRRLKMSLSKSKPLEAFDFQLIQRKFEGILINVDRDLERRLKAAEKKHEELARQLLLAILMVRIARNSYAALSVLLLDTDNSQKRRKFVLVVPPVNRQLMDLLCTLVYIRDDFAARSLAFQLASYRDFREEYARYYSRFGNLPEWKNYFSQQRILLSVLGRLLKITRAQKQKPILIPRWFGPFKLSKQKTASHSFLEWVVTWLYGDTSAEAHLTGVGPYAIGGFLLTDLGSEEDRRLAETRAILQYHFRHFSRLIMTVLAIATELDAQFRLQNHMAIAYVWGILAKYVPEAKDMYDERYAAMLATP